MALWSFATLGHLHPDLFSAAFARLASSPNLFATRQLAMMVRACATLNYHPDPTHLSVLESTVVTRLGGARPFEVCHILWSFARLGTEPSFLLDALHRGPHAEDLLAEFDGSDGRAGPTDLVHACWALVGSLQYEHPLYHVLSHHVARIRPGYKFADEVLTEVAHVVSLSEVRDGGRWSVRPHSLHLFPPFQFWRTSFTQTSSSHVCHTQVESRDGVLLFPGKMRRLALYLGQQRAQDQERLDNDVRVVVDEVAGVLRGRGVAHLVYPQVRKVTAPIHILLEDRPVATGTGTGTGTGMSASSSSSSSSSSRGARAGRVDPDDDDEDEDEDDGSGYASRRVEVDDVEREVGWGHALVVEGSQDLTRGHLVRTGRAVMHQRVLWAAGLDVITIDAGWWQEVVHGQEKRDPVAVLRELGVPFPLDGPRTSR